LAIYCRYLESDVAFDLQPSVFRHSSATVRGLTVREYENEKPGEYLCKVLLEAGRPSVHLNTWRYGEVPTGFVASSRCAELERGKRYLFAVWGPGVYSFKEFALPARPVESGVRTEDLTNGAFGNSP